MQRGQPDDVDKCRWPLSIQDVSNEQWIKYEVALPNPRDMSFITDLHCLYVIRLFENGGQIIHIQLTFRIKTAPDG